MSANQNDERDERVKGTKTVNDEARGQRKDRSENRNRSEGLGLLLADVLAGPEGDRQTLIRYADDPAALAASERTGFENRLANDPGLRDRLAALRGFDPRGAHVQVDEADDGVVTPMVERRRRAWMPWVGVAAAAGLATLAILPLLGGPRGEVGEVSVVEGDPGSAQAPELEFVVTPPVPDAATPQWAVEAPKSESNEPGEPVPANEPAPTEGARLANESVPSEPAIPAPAVEAVPETPEAAAEEPAMRLAAHYEPVSYQAPSDFLARVSPSAVVRSSSSAPALVAWVPDHVAHTSTPQPTLYWSLDGAIPDGHSVGLVVTAESALEPLYEGDAAIDPAQGWQHTDLATLGISLASGEVYRWSVFLRDANGEPAADRIAQGWIEYRAPSDENAAILDRAALGTRAARFAEQGYWYDALALLADTAARHPEDGDARKRLDGFLDRAGVATITR